MQITQYIRANIIEYSGYSKFFLKNFQWENLLSGTGKIVWENVPAIKFCHTTVYKTPCDMVQTDGTNILINHPNWQFIKWARKCWIDPEGIPVRLFFYRLMCLLLFCFRLQVIDPESDQKPDCHDKVKDRTSCSRNTFVSVSQ